MAETFIIFTNVDEKGDHSKDTVVVQGSGESFGMFNMNSVVGNEAYDVYEKLKGILKN